MHGPTLSFALTKTYGPIGVNLREKLKLLTPHFSSPSRFFSCPPLIVRSLLLPQNGPFFLLLFIFLFFFILFLFFPLFSLFLSFFFLFGSYPTELPCCSIPIPFKFSFFSLLFHLIFFPLFLHLKHDSK